METRICRKCQENKNIDEFYKSGLYRGKQYYYLDCKVCARKTSEELREKHKRSEKPIITQKFCPKCKETLSIEKFRQVKERKDGYGGWCLECEKAQEKIRRQKRTDSEKIEIDGKICGCCKMYKLSDCFYKNKTNVDGLDRICRDCATERRIRDMPKIVKHIKERREKDPTYRLITLIRNRIRDTIKIQSKSKSAKSMELLGCTGAECMNYLEKLFWPGMTRGNMGRNGWVVDHIIPIDAFDKTDPDWQFKCFHYTNLQPLWWADNHTKSNRLDWTPKESKYELPERLKIKGNL